MDRQSNAREIENRNIHTNRSWSSKVRLLLDNWRHRNHESRKKYDFSVSHQLQDFLTEVARSEVASNHVVSRLRRTPRLHQYSIIVRGPEVMGVVAYFSIAFGGVALSVIAAAEGLKMLIIFGAILLAIFVLQRFLRISTRVTLAYADMPVLSRCIRVIETAEKVQRDLTRNDLRQKLAKDINDAAALFKATYPVQRKLSTGLRRRLNRRVRECTDVLSSYADDALSGDQKAITNLREDYARAVLRIGSGNWAQVCDLRPSINGSKRFRDFLPKHFSAPVLQVAITAIATGVAIVKVFI